MHILHHQLEEDGELRGAVQKLSEAIRDNPLKHGLVLDLNPYWLYAYKLWSLGIRPEIYDYRDMWGVPLDPGSLADIPDFTRQFTYAKQATEWVFERKHSYLPQFQPYLLRIQAHPIKSPDRALFDQRYALVNAAREAQIPTVVDSLDPPQLVAAAGERVLSPAGDKGTIGGFLKEAISGEIYAVTCAHVIASGTASLKSGFLGTCQQASSPVPLPAGAVCHAGCPHITELDLALIECGSTSVINTATSIAVYVSNGQLVEMDGATSGTVRYEVGGAVVEQEIGGHCWSKLYQVHAPVSGSMIPASVKVATTTLPQDGDSGAWLLRAKTEWAGMVVASNALHGYALPATTVHAGAERLAGTKLDLV